MADNEENEEIITPSEIPNNEGESSEQNDEPENNDTPEEPIETDSEEETDIDPPEEDEEVVKERKREKINAFTGILYSIRNLIKTISILWNDNIDGIEEEVAEGVVEKKVFDVLYFYLNDDNSINQNIGNFYNVVDQVQFYYEFAELFEGGQEYFDRAISIGEDINTTKDVIDKVNKHRTLSFNSLGARKQEFFNSIDQLLSDLADAYPDFVVYQPDEGLTEEQEKAINAFECSLQLPGIKKLLNEIGNTTWQWIVSDYDKVIYKLTYDNDITKIYDTAKAIDTTTLHKVIDETFIAQMDLLISDILETEGIEEENEAQKYYKNSLAKNKAFFVYRLKKWIFNVTGEEVKIAEPSKADSSSISRADDRDYNVESTLIHHRLNTVYRSDKHSVADINTLKGGLHTIAFEDDLYILNTSEKFLSSYRLRLGMEVYCIDTGRKFRLIGGDMICNKSECKCTLVQGKCNEEAKGCTGMFIKNPKWIQVMEFKYLEETLNQKVRTTYDINEEDDPRIVINMEYLKRKLFNHTHDGTTSKRISFFDLNDTNKIDAYMLGGHTYDFFAPRKHTHDEFAFKTHGHPEILDEIDKFRIWVKEVFLEKNKIEIVKLEEDTITVGEIVNVRGNSNKAARSDHTHRGYYLEKKGNALETQVKTNKETLTEHINNKGIHTPYDDTAIQGRVEGLESRINGIGVNLTRHIENNNIHKLWSEIKIYVDNKVGEIDVTSYLTRADKEELKGLINANTSLINGLSASLIKKLNIPEEITAGTACKVTFNKYGLITGAGNLSISDIPDLPDTKVPNLDRRVTILEGQVGLINSQVTVYIAPDIRYYDNNGFTRGTDGEGKIYYTKSGMKNRYGGDKFYPGSSENLELQYANYGKSKAREYPVFDLNQAMVFLRRFRANGKITYLISCEAGEYYFDDNQMKISHPDGLNNEVYILGVRNDNYINISNKKSVLDTLSDDFNNATGESKLALVYRTIFKFTPTAIKNNNSFKYFHVGLNINENTLTQFRYCWFVTNYHANVPSEDKRNIPENQKQCYIGTKVNSSDSCAITVDQAINVKFISCGFFGITFWNGTITESKLSFQSVSNNPDYTSSSPMSINNLENYYFPTVVIKSPNWTSCDRAFCTFYKGIVIVNVGYYYIKHGREFVRVNGNSGVLSISTNWNAFIKIDFTRTEDSTFSRKSVFSLTDTTSSVNSGGSNPTISNPLAQNTESEKIFRINYWYNGSDKVGFVTKYEDIIYPYQRGYDENTGIKADFRCFNRDTDSANPVGNFAYKCFRYNGKQFIDNSDIGPINTNNTDLLKILYPVGSIYIGTQVQCPLATLIPGSTWDKITGRYLLASGQLVGGGTSENYNVQQNIEGGLPNITGECGSTSLTDDEPLTNCDGAYSDGALSLTNKSSMGGRATSSGAGFCRIKFNAQSSNNTYGKSLTVRPPAYTVNVWRRTN